MEQQELEAARIEAQRVRAALAQARARGLRQREAAIAAATSEGGALAAHTPALWPDRRATDIGPHALPLRPDWLALLQALQPCGPLMALTRNDSVVHEKVGVYENLSAEGAVGLALGRDIDLRLFFRHWHTGFAVSDAPGEVPRSIQIFDEAGRAVHKIFVRPNADARAWQSALAPFVEGEGLPPAFVTTRDESDEGGEVDCDVAEFLHAWSQMTDTHEFFGVLKRFGVSRWQAMQLARGHYTERKSPYAVERLLQAAAFEGVPIMVFVGNSGCIQIHTGPVRRVETLDLHGQTWVNVLDEGFNLHLLLDDVDSCWVVRKPTVDGEVTSLEVYDRRGRCVAMLFGARKPGQPESGAWRGLLRALEEVTA